MWYFASITKNLLVVVFFLFTQLFLHSNVSLPESNFLIMIRMNSSSHRIGSSPSCFFFLRGFFMTLHGWRKNSNYYNFNFLGARFLCFFVLAASLETKLTLSFENSFFILCHVIQSMLTSLNLNPADVNFQVTRELRSKSWLFATKLDKYEIVENYSGIKSN